MKKDNKEKGGALFPNSDEACEILHYLQEKLEMPECVRGFELHIKMDEAVTIKNMEYHPRKCGKEGSTDE